MIKSPDLNISTHLLLNILSAFFVHFNANITEKQWVLHERVRYLHEQDVFKIDTADYYQYHKI